MAAPYLISSNFDSSKKEEVHLQSDSSIGFSIGDSDNQQAAPDGHVLSEHFSQAQLEHLDVLTESRAEETEFAVRATHSTKGHYIRFALKRKPDGTGFVADLSRVSKKPNLPLVNDEHAAFRLSNLWAKQEVDRFIRQYDRNAAAQVATVFRLVTPVTSAVVLETSRDYGRFGLHRQRYSVLDDSLHTGLYRQSNAAATPAADGAPVLQGAAISGIFSPEELGAMQSTQSMDSMAPTLQGATNGTIGPQGSDATYITGVNTAGTMVTSDGTIADLVPFANLAMCFAGLFIAIFTFANERGCKWAQVRGFTRKERRSA